MSEIEKMYSMVLNFKKECCNPYVDPEYCAKDCSECGYFEYDYPLFTKEKQFELIEFIAGCVRVRDLTIRKSNNKFHLVTLMTVECDVRKCAVEAYTICYCNQPFKEQIASCINHLINADKLTSKERKQLKEILE